MKKIVIPNPDSETRIRVQSIGTYSISKKYVATLLVVRLFLDLLGVLRGCAINMFSLSGFVTNLNKQYRHHSHYLHGGDV